MSRAVANADAMDGMSSFRDPAVGGVSSPSRSFTKTSSSARIDAPRVAGGGAGVDDWVSVDMLTAEVKRCELAVLEEVECRMRAHSKAHRMQLDMLDKRLDMAEADRQTHGDTCAMLLARLEKLEERAKAHDEVNVFIRSNLQAHDRICAVFRSSHEKVEERLQAAESGRRVQEDRLLVKIASLEQNAKVQENRFRGIPFVFLAVLVIAVAFALATSVKPVRKVEEQANTSRVQFQVLEAMCAEMSKTQQDHATALDVQRQALEALRKETSHAQTDHATALEAQGKALEALRKETSHAQTDHATALVAQGEALEALRKETSKAEKDHATALEVYGKALEALRKETSKAEKDHATALEVHGKALEAMRKETSKAEKEQTTALEAHGKELQDVKAQFNEVTRKHADTDMIAQLALAHLAGHVPEVAKHIGGEELHAALVKFRNEDVGQRINAARILGRLGGSSRAAGAVARNALVAALRGDSDWQVRLKAATSLGVLPDATSVPSLTTALREDMACDVRREAAKSLGLVGAPAAFTAVEVLKSAMRKDLNGGVTAAAAGALLALGAEEPTFAEAQGIALRILRQGTSWRQRQVAAWAVGRGCGAEARAALEKAASGDAEESVRAEAIKALETLRA